MVGRKNIGYLVIPFIGRWEKKVKRPAQEGGTQHTWLHTIERVIMSFHYALSNYFTARSVLGKSHETLVVTHDGQGQCPGRFLGITNRYHSVPKSNRLRVDIFRFSFVKWSVIYLQSRTSTCYFSNSTIWSVTNCRFSLIIGRGLLLYTTYIFHYLPKPNGRPCAWARCPCIPPPFKIVPPFVAVCYITKRLGLWQSNVSGRGPTIFISPAPSAYE